MSSLMVRIRQHLSDPHSNHRRIAAGFLWVSFFVFVGKLAGAAKEMVIAWRYGISETVDAYVIVFNLICWPVGVWFSVLTAVLIPLVAKARSENPEELPGFRGELLGITLLAGFLLGGLSYWALPILLKSSWSGLSGNILSSALNMVTSLSLLLPLGMVISLFSAWMMACDRHRNTLLEALPALTILIALLLPSGTFPEPLVWGTVFGFALQLAGLAWPLNKLDELQFPTIGFNSVAWKGFWGSVGIMGAGQALMSFTVIVDQFFAAHLGAGAIATLSYANRILALLLGLGAMAISRATLPIFSEVATNRGMDEIFSLAMRWAKLMFMLGGGVMVVAWLLTPSIVQLLFERGAFGAEDSLKVISVTRFYLFQVPFYFYAIVLVSALSSMKKYSVLLIGGLIGLIAKPVGNVVLVKYFGIGGIALSAAFLYLSNSLYMTYKLKSL